MIEYPALLDRLEPFYPIDREQPYNEADPAPDWYVKTEEYQRLKQVIEVSNSEEVTQPFSVFTEKLQGKLGLPATNQTSLLAPCNAVKFELERKETADFLLIREIHCMVSDLLPYFIVFGTTLICETKCPFKLDGQGNPSIMPYSEIIVSKPIANFEQAMSMAIGETQASFPQHELIPWRMAMASVYDLYHAGVPSFYNRTIFNLLFNATNYKVHKIVE